MCVVRKSGKLYFVHLWKLSFTSRLLELRFACTMCTGFSFAFWRDARVRLRSQNFAQSCSVVAHRPPHPPALRSHNIIAHRRERRARAHSRLSCRMPIDFPRRYVPGMTNNVPPEKCWRRQRASNIDCRPCANTRPCARCACRAECQRVCRRAPHCGSPTRRLGPRRLDGRFDHCFTRVTLP